MPQSGKLRARIPMWSMNVFNVSNPSSGTKALGSTQPLTEVSTIFLGRKAGQPMLKADNLTAICEPTL
jgi:hypothetical protein